ncbi:MAG: NFACT family protein [Oscillospiraceae bacterium]|nr:NFACT family protein [Oscillospiraceae bacterium]
MALDAATMSLLAGELDDRLQASRVDKIHQPSKDEVVLHMRSRDGNIKLLLSARSGSARICITQEAFENPLTPPSFCMLLRKYLSGARFVGARSVKGDRIIILSFSTVNEMGDTVDIDIAAELMGRYANLVIINRDGRIIDAMKRVDADASSVRQLLPGLMYKLPPNKEAFSLFEQTDELLGAVFAFHGPTDKAILKNASGIGPVICREIAFLSGTRDRYADELNALEKEAVRRACEAVKDHYRKPEYTVVHDRLDKPAEFSFMPLRQYGDLRTESFDDLNSLLDSYYAEKDRKERLRQKGKDLHRLVSNLTERNRRKQAARESELEQSSDNERYRIYGELLTANLYRLEKGMRSVEVENYYDGSTVTIPLDPKLSGNANAQKYYREYRKKQTAVKMLTELLRQGEIESEYLASVAYSVESATSEAELLAIRSELHERGYIKYFKNRDKRQKARDYIRYVSSDGFNILVGRNNIQNERLTLKTARGKDMWFHVKNAPGSHVVIMSEGADIPLTSQEEAAALAVLHSSLNGNAAVDVDYTFVRNIRKTGDLKPGMVIYDTYETVHISADPRILARLTVKNR